ncbi:MAG: NAD+ synthase [Chloroflexi bacterium]|nr:NAD+ synthase [Chloroflexota bacterium]
MRTLRLGLGQINATVGDLGGNTARIKEYIDRARELGVDLIAFPELALTGYPPEDLLLKPHFIQDNLRHLQEIVAHSQGIACVVGFVDAKEDLYNAAAVIHDGQMVGVYHKNYLPNYGVFDENRYFQAGRESPIYTIGGVHIGVNICEDIWYPTGPTTYQVQGGAEVVVNISSSPYYAGKSQLREKMLVTRASDEAVFVAYINMVGGQDELLFDGQSIIVDERGVLLARGRAFQEDLVVAELDIDRVFHSRLHDPRRRRERLEGRRPPRIVVSTSRPDTPRPPIANTIHPLMDPVEEVYHALVLGTGDYVRKNGFKRVVIGLSGGIDSSLVAAIASDALGPENVTGVAMPSPYSSPRSRADAKALAENLGIELKTIPITPLYKQYLKTLEPPFRGTKPGVAEENIQARIRGNLLMALSNKFGWLVLTTGNKSELATGYATLYGDMAGGFAVLKDVPKTLVYKLAQFRNGGKGKWKPIPRAIFLKPPSAELRPDQRDSDSLPPYETLDPILQAYVEEDRSQEEIVTQGFDRRTVERVVEMVDRNEYKRRQAPPGIKITPRAFGKDRRLPITSRYRESR